MSDNNTIFRMKLALAIMLIY